MKWNNLAEKLKWNVILLLIQSQIITCRFINIINSMNRSFCSLTFWRQDSFEVFTFWSGTKHFAFASERTRELLCDKFKGSKVACAEAFVKKIKKERKKRSFAGPFSRNFNLVNNKEGHVKESPELIKTHCL